MEENKIYEIAAELDGVSAIIIGLRNQLDNQYSDTLSSDAFDNALHAVAWHLDRIVKDLREFDEKTGEQ